MSRIAGSFLRIGVGLGLIGIVVLGALASPDDGAPVDIILIDPGGLARQDGPPPGVAPDDVVGRTPREPGPGGYLARQMMEVADTNKDGLLTPEEAAQAAARFVRDADRDGRGSIDVDGLASAMNRRMGPPRGFGPGRPGFGGPGPRHPIPRPPRPATITGRPRTSADSPADGRAASSDQGPTAPGW